MALAICFPQFKQLRFARFILSSLCVLHMLAASAAVSVSGRPSASRLGSTARLIANVGEALALTTMRALRNVCWFPALGSRHCGLKDQLFLHDLAAPVALKPERAPSRRCRLAVHHHGGLVLFTGLIFARRLSWLPWSRSFSAYLPRAASGVRRRLCTRHNRLGRAWDGHTRIMISYHFTAPQRGHIQYGAGSVVLAVIHSH